MDDMEHTRLPLQGLHGEGKFTLVDGDYDGEYFSTLRLWLNPVTGYVTTRVDGKMVNLHTLVCPPRNGLWADHKNRNKLDNRSCNLRLITPSENSKNSDRYENLIRISQVEKEAKHRAWKREYEKNSPIRKAWILANKDKTREYSRLYQQRRRIAQKEKPLG